MRLNELALGQAVRSLAEAGIHTVEQLAGQRLNELLRQPAFTSGIELYELICDLHDHNHTPFSGPGGHVQGDRELEILRLRIVQGHSLAQIGEQVGVKTERVRQLLKIHFGLSGSPPAAKRRPPISPREHTRVERARTYLQARRFVAENYAQPLSLATVAKAVACSPRQLQRVYADCAPRGFRAELTRTRVNAAARLLRDTTLPAQAIAEQVGYQHAAYLARVFRLSYGLTPAAYRTRSQTAADRSGR